MNNLLKNIMKKKKFKSNILSNSDQEYLFKNIKDIKIFKGKTKISDIAFITKNDFIFYLVFSKTKKKSKIY